MPLDNTLKLKLIFSKITLIIYVQILVQNPAISNRLTIFLWEQLSEVNFSNHTIMKSVKTLDKQDPLIQSIRLADRVLINKSERNL